MSTEADNYLRQVVDRIAAGDVERRSAASVAHELMYFINRWGGEYVSGTEFSGSFAKQTSLKKSTDIDILISLRHTCPYTLKEIYNSLHALCANFHLQPRKQNVSINITYKGKSIDLVPARRQDERSSDHSLYRRRADSWTKTNIRTHITHVVNSSRREEIILTKRWRDINGLEWPSFYVELSVIEALKGSPKFALSTNFWRVLEYLRDDFEDRLIIDPANCLFATLRLGG